MPVGLSAAQANAFLAALCRGVAYTPPSAFWVQLHTGDPGAAGTSNVAGNATRKQPTFGAESGGAISNSAVVSWSSGEVGSTESYAFWSAWTAPAGGAFLVSGLASGAVVAGNSFQVPIGSIDIVLTVAS